MAKKNKKRVKHVPQRTCVGCRSVLAKRTLIRIVRGSEGVQVDPTGKASGRGAYLHDLRSCWERSLKGSLAHALRTTLSEHEVKQLAEFITTLRDDRAAYAVASEEDLEKKEA